ncbi:MAG: ABC transporter ATP-binding protein [Acidobacteria bacterium]|nr:ABC transporter ATP-binding protein [Acidobacteriota bacterium]
MLSLEGLDVVYGDFQALFGLDLHVDAAETVSIIGANGAGKSTLLKAICGLATVRSGRVAYKGADLAGVAAHRRVGQGIAMVPEGRRIFPSLTVEENIVIGGHAGRRGPWTKEAVLAAFPLLERLRKRGTDGLSGGERQTLAIARALMANPDLLLLDEVSLGLAPIVVKQVYEAIPAIKAQGTTVLVVEQDVNQALSVCDRFYCLLEGRISLTGRPGEVPKERITDAYFGLSSVEGGH